MNAEEVRKHEARPMSTCEDVASAASGLESAMLRMQDVVSYLQLELESLLRRLKEHKESLLRLRGMDRR